MERGKEICKALKEIRRQIALNNDIEFVTSECKHKGSCNGTCPKCEQELQYLEEQLASRKRLGKATRVVGLSLSLAALAPVFFESCDPLKGDPVVEETNPLEGDPVKPSSSEDGSVDNSEDSSEDSSEANS